MKKIVFIIPTIGFGGAEKVYIEVASSLNKDKRYDVELLFLTRLVKERNLPEGLKSKCFYVSSTKAGFFKVLKYMKEKKPDFVFSSLTHLNLMMIFMKKTFKLPFKLYVRHTYNLSNIQGDKNLLNTIKLKIHQLYKYADGVIFQSKFMYKDFVNTIPLSNCFVIGNPINTERMSKLALEYQPDFLVDKDFKRIFLYVGRLAEIKNVDYLIHSFSRYQNKEFSKLIIIGDGREKENLKKLIGYLELDQCVEILDGKKNPFPYIKNCDALFLCSKSEGFPNVVLESLGLNTPVFVRKHKGGTEEVLQNLNLSDYFLEEIDFNSIETLLEYYPKNFAEKTGLMYGIDTIVREYVYLIEN